MLWIIVCFSRLIFVGWKFTIKHQGQYGLQRVPWCQRLFLHCLRLEFLDVLAVYAGMRHETCVVFWHIDLYSKCFITIYHYSSLYYSSLFITTHHYSTNAIFLCLLSELCAPVGLTWLSPLEKDGPGCSPFVRLVIALHQPFGGHHWFTQQIAAWFPRGSVGDLHFSAIWADYPSTTNLRIFESWVSIHVSGLPQRFSWFFLANGSGFWIGPGRSSWWRQPCRRSWRRCWRCWNGTVRISEVPVERNGDGSRLFADLRLFFDLMDPPRTMFHWGFWKWLVVWWCFMFVYFWNRFDERSYATSTISGQHEDFTNRNSSFRR